MLSSLLVRLTMVAFTMAVVCWIGWTVPASRAPETLHAQAPVESNHSPIVSGPLITPSPPLARPSQSRSGRLSRPPATMVMLDLNRATEQDFERLPGIGPVLARRIVQYRQVQGTFQDIEELRQVKGIGKKTFERIRAHVTVTPPAITRPTRKTA